MIRRKEGIGYLIVEMARKDIENGLLKKITIKESLPKIELKLVYNNNTLLEIPKMFLVGFRED